MGQHRQPHLLLLLTVATVFGACAGPAEEEVVACLTGGVWHGVLGEADYLYEIARGEDGSLGGTAHQVVDGRELTEAPIRSVAIDGAEIEMELTIPAYRGTLDLSRQVIRGGHPDAPRYRELDLTRVAVADWPMIRHRLHPDGAPPRLWSPPPVLDDGWPTAAPAEVGLDPAAAEATLAAIIGGDAGSIHSFLVVRNGRLVVEEYFHGWQRDDLHRLASCTKSVSSLLVGIAIDQGDLAGVEAPLLDFFPDHDTSVASGWGEARLEHVLTMSLGLDWSDAEAERFPPLDVDRHADVLGRGFAATPGSRWRYVSRDIDLLSAVLRRATGVHADVFAAEHLFVPLGMTAWDWEEARSRGYPAMSGTLKLRPRDFAKLGQMVLDEGSWRGRQIVSAAWISESTRHHHGDPAFAEKYGYLWWRLEDPDEPPHVLIYAAGKGTQYIFVVPDYDMVIVTTGGNEYNGQQMAIMGVAKEHLQPGIDVGS